MTILYAMLLSNTLIYYMMLVLTYPKWKFEAVVISRGWGYCYCDSSSNTPLMLFYWGINVILICKKLHHFDSSIFLINYQDSICRNKHSR